MTSTDLNNEKLLEEIKALRRPWYLRTEYWVAFVAIFTSIASFTFQYSLHDQNVLIAKNEKSLAEQEKIKAENEKFLIVKERIALTEKLEKYELELKKLIEDHNKSLATTLTDAKETQALIKANYQFLESIGKQRQQASAATPPLPGKTKYFSWVDELLSALISYGGFLIVALIVYRFLARKHPEFFEAIRLAVQEQNKKG